MINKKRIEMKIIQHKNTEDFFRGFFNENDAIQYGYQLRRMFEASACFENDYLIFEVDKKSFMSIEIYRTATRRVLSLNPQLSPLFTDDEKKEYFTSVFENFINYQAEMYQMVRFENPLEIILNSDYEFYEEMKLILDKYKFENLYTKYELSIELSQIPDITLEKQYSFDKFISFGVEERYSFIEKADIYMKKLNIDVRKLYIDYIEENVESEELWEIIRDSENKLGYILPMFDNARKNLQIFDYNFFSEKTEVNFKILLNRIKEIAQEKEVGKMKINIYKEDESIFDILKLDGNTKRIIKKSYIYDYR